MASSLVLPLVIITPSLSWFVTGSFTVDPISLNILEKITPDIFDTLGGLNYINVPLCPVIYFTTTAPLLFFFFGGVKFLSITAFMASRIRL